MIAIVLILGTTTCNYMLVTHIIFSAVCAELVLRDGFDLRYSTQVLFVKNNGTDISKYFHEVEI